MKCARFLALISACLLLTFAAEARAQDDWDDDWEEESALPVEIHGFVEGAGGARVSDDPTRDDDFTLGEARFRLDLSHFANRAQLAFKGDIVDDAVTGETVIDVRQAWVSMTAARWLDIRVGRQVLTWGTGDLVFLNDLFPKDFVSFFIGRDTEFLKAPANTLKASAYSKPVNVDLVWTPIFTPDEYITGERLSFYDPMSGAIVSPDPPITAELPTRKIDNGELAGRLFRTVRGYEVAAYGYWGYFKQPSAVDTVSMMPTFAELSVWGASVRGNALGGVANLEGAYYDSRRDRDGTDPTLPNSHIRALAGYEREVVTKLTLGLQYYIEWLQKYDALVASAPSPEQAPRETRQMITTRLNWRLKQETLTLSLFAFIALEDGDTHWRPAITRQWTDNVSVAIGANIMAGDDDTFFGQLENNSNAYLRVRYSF